MAEMEFVYYHTTLSNKNKLLKWGIIMIHLHNQFFAPPPETGLWPEINNFEEGVKMHLPFNKEGAL